MTMEKLKAIDAKLDVNSNLEDLWLAQQSEEVKQKAKLEEAELKWNIINVTKTVEDYAKNSDWSIDRKKVSTFGLNMWKLGYSNYEEFSKALNLQQIQDKKIIQDQNKGIKEKEIDKILKKTYTQKIKEMMDVDLPEWTKIENFLWSADKTYNKITGAYMEWTYKTNNQETTAFKVQNDKDLWIDKEKETNTEELTTQEMKKISKDLMKFLNSESLSTQEKQQIKFFIKTVANIDRKTVNEKPIEKQILEYFASTPDSLSFTKENRMEADKIKWLTIKESDAKRLQKLNQLYYQAMNWQNQTLRRLFYIVSQEWSVAEAKTSFDWSITKEKENEKYIKQQSNKFEAETFVTGEKLWYKKENLAKAKAYITTIDTEKKQDTKTIISAITDFDFNWFLNHKDSWSKTWLQIQKIISGFWEEKSLENILALANKIWSKSWLTEKITRDNLLNSIESPTYLLLIQNMLKDPSFDITDIVRYWDKTVENIYSLSETSAETISTQSDKMINELKKLWVPVEAWLKDVVSTTILKAYADYGYWLWIPLDSFIKGLSFNLWLAHFPQWAEDFGINIWWNGRKTLGKWREATAWISGWTTLIFIPMASAQWWFIKTLDNKKQSTSLDVRSSKKIQISWHAIVMPGYAWYWASMGMEKSKRDSILEQSPRLQSTLTAFFAKILEPKEWEKTFIFDKTELETRLQDALKESFKNSKKDTITKAVNNISLILAAYDGLPKEKIWEASAKIAESYANARVNQKAKDINNKRYLWWAGLSVTFFEGIIPVVWVLTFKKNKITSYNDTNPEMIKTAENGGTWNEKYKDWISKLIEEINKNTWSEIKLEWELITIPKSTRTEKNLEVRINENMKWLVKTDKDGNLILHKDTPIRFFDAYLSDRWRKVLNIGEFSSTEWDKKLDSKNSEIQKDFVAEKEIPKEKIPVKIEPNTKNVNEIVNKIREQITDKDNTSLKDITVEVVWWTVVFKALDKEVWKLENITNQSKIIISKKNDWVLNFEKTEDKEQKRLAIQLIENSDSEKERATEIKEFDDDISNKVISEIYTEWREITDNLFHNIIHNQTAPKYKFKADYEGFNKNLKDWNYIEANNNLKSMLVNINKYTKDKYNRESFVETRKNLESNLDEYQLIKVLSGFNVLFSRTANVKVEKWRYTYQYWMEKTTWERIIEENESRIKNGKEYYKGWFTEQFKSYRPTDSKELNKENVDSLFTKIKTERTKSNIDFNKQEKTKNTISFNHGNPKDYFKLQTNPELVWGLRIKMDDLKDWKNDNFIEDLKSAYINQLIATEEKLLDNMFKTLWVTETLSKEEKLKVLSWEGLDTASWKNIKAEYEHNFGYNPECNNLMRLMENLKIKILDKTKLEKKYEATLEWNELVVNYADSNSRINMQEKRFSVAWVKTFETTPPTPPPTEPDPENPDPTDPDPENPENPDPTDPDPTDPTTTPWEEEVPTTPNPTEPDPTTTPWETETTTNSDQTPNTWWDWQSGYQSGWRG